MGTTKLEEIWTEKELCERLNLPITKSGRSAQLSYWVKGGLKCAEKAGRRFFFEEDIVTYLKGRRDNTDDAR